MTQTPTVLFDGDHVQALHFSGGSDFTVVTFGNLGLTANGKRAFASDWATKNNINLIGFVATGRNWYPYQETNRAVDNVKAFIDRPSVTYGSSMGGYGALKFSNRIGAQAALAFGPQTSIDPAITGPQDRRFSAYHSQELNGEMGLSAAEICPNAFAFFDPRHVQDRYQIGLIDNHSSISKIPLPYSGHGIVELMASSAIAEPAMREAMNGQDRELVIRLKKRKRALPDYYVNLAKHLMMRRKNELAKDIAEHGYALFPTYWKLAISFTQALLNLENPTKALTIFSPIAFEYPEHPTIQNHMALILAATGQIKQALIRVEHQISRVDNIALRMTQIRLLDQSGDFLARDAAHQAALHAFPTAQNALQALIARLNKKR